MEENNFLMIIFILAMKISLIVLLSYFCFRVSYSIWWKPKWLEKRLQQQRIRGNPYKPFIGDMLDYTNHISQAWSKPMSLSHHIVPQVDPFTHSTVQKYGNISLNWIGTIPRINIMDPELIKEVLTNEQHHLGVTPLVSDPYVLMLSKGLTILEGETWAKHRKIMRPVLNLERLKGMISAYAESSALSVEKWGKALAVEETCEMDVWPEFLDLTGDIISRTVFGSSFEQGNRVISLQKELQKLVLETIQYSYIPGFRFIPTRKNRRLKSLDKSINSILETLIERKETTLRTGITTDGEDLLGSLLKSNYAYSEQSNGSSTDDSKMTMKEIVEELKQFYVSGYETTSSLLTWTMVALGRSSESLRSKSS